MVEADERIADVQLRAQPACELPPGFDSAETEDCVGLHIGPQRRHGREPRDVWKEALGD